MVDSGGAQPQGGTVARSVVPMFADILCAIDGKPGGFTAVEQAAALAGVDGHITLLAVTSFRSEGTLRSPAIGPAEAKRITDRAVVIAEEAQVAHTVEVDPASPASQVVLDWSAGRDLLALGAPNASWLGGMFIAGVADTALGAFTTPLLVARPTPAGRHVGDRILVASDGLEGSDELVELTARLARARESSVTLLHATGHEPHIRRHRSEEQEQRLAEQGQRLEEHLAAGTSQVLVEPNSAQAVIVAAAESLGASLVVMGSRGLDGLRAFGSVSRHVVHDAHCSVMLFSPEHLERRRGSAGETA